MSRCPRHDEPLGETTRMCLACHDEAWDEVGRRYADQGRQVDRQPEPQEEEPQMTITSTELAESELLPAVIEEPLSAPVTLFGTSDPKVALARMADVAKAVVDVIDSQKLYALISGKKYVTCPGWKTVGGMYGLSPYTVWTRPNETGDGFVARVEIRTLDERTIAAAEAECGRDESHWKGKPRHALRSMAETRATSRAFRGPLEQIFVMAGFQPAAAEEMSDIVIDAKPKTDATSESESAARRGPIPDAIKPTDDQVAELRRLLDELTAARPDVDWKARAKEIAGTSGDMLTTTTMMILIGKLGRELEQEEEPAA